jgi:hypothetical protein
MEAVFPASARARSMRQTHLRCYNLTGAIIKISIKTISYKFFAFLKTGLAARPDCGNLKSARQGHTAA